MTARFILAAAAGLLAACPSFARDEQAACIAAVATARREAAELPGEDPSRRFAEHDLDTALTEMNAGETEECPGLVEKARTTITTRPYRLRPGERLHGHGPEAQN